MSSVPDRPQPWLATVLLAAFMLSCTGEPATQSPTPAPNEPAPAAPPFATTSTDRLTNTPTERGFAEKRFERVESMLRRGVLSCDTITYVCPNGRGEGSFTYCSVEGELLLAAHTYARGQQTTGSEAYYFDGEARFLSDLTTSVLTSAGGGNEDTGPNEETRIRQERRYYYEGNLIDRGYRDFRMSSRGPNPTPDAIPYVGEGEAITGGIGQAAVLAVRSKGTYVCD